MKRILIDMDDVICQKGFINMVNEFLNTDFKEEDAGSYYINDLIPKEKFKDWLDYFEKRNVYDYVETVDYAKEVIEKLNQIYDIYIVTAYHNKKITNEELEKLNIRRVNGWKKIENILID